MRSQLTFLFLSFVSFIRAADKPTISPRLEKVNRQNMAIRMLQIADARYALEMTASRIKANHGLNEHEAQEEVKKIKGYLAIIPFNAVCVKSLKKIICTFAKKGYAFEVLQLFVAIKQCEDNPECIRQIAGQALVSLKKQELMTRPFFCSDQFNPIYDERHARVRDILEQQFKAAEHRPHVNNFQSEY